MYYKRKDGAKLYHFTNRFLVGDRKSSDADPQKAYEQFCRDNALDPKQMRE